MVIETPITAAIFILCGRVRGADVRGFAPIVPGHDLDEVGLQLEKVQPFVDPDAVVLRVQPVHVRAETLEEPGRDGRDPFLILEGGAVTGVLGVDGGFLGCGEKGVDPGEEAVGVGV